MAKLTELVKKSVGFSALRNDEVSVTNLSFGTNSPEQDFLYKQSPVTDWYGWGWKVLILAAMAGGVMIIRSLLNRMRVQIPSLPISPGFAVQAATAALRTKQNMAALNRAGDEEISEEVLLRSERRKKVTEYVREKPSDTSRLLKVWLAEE